MTVSERRVLVGFPALILAASFVAICIREGTPWPWNRVVHEDGSRTLLQTIFYFEHALGELPLEIIIAASLAGAALALFVPAVRPVVTWKLGAAALSVDALIFVGACVNVGWHDACTWLLQYHTRKEAPLMFGSHWRYHLLSLAALMLWAAILLRICAFLRLNRVDPLLKRRSRFLLWTWIVFGACALIFGVDASSFRDPRFLGHQARETFTHALVSIPLAAAACLAIAGPLKIAEPVSRIRFWQTTVGLMLACGALTAYQAVGTLLTDSRSQAQSNDATRIVFNHFFEHTLSYLVVSIHAVWCFSLAGSAAEKRA